MSRKPGVKASLVLDRATGAILKTSGDLSALRTSKSREEATVASFANEAPVAEESESKGLDQFAATIWNYVGNSSQTVQELDAEVCFTGKFYSPELTTTGRVETTATSHKEAGDCYRTRLQIPPHRDPRYSARLNSI